jgi:hypothetical protein
MPIGCDNSMSPGRTEIRLSVISTFTSLSLFTQASIRDEVTRKRTRYQRPCSKLTNFVVSFSEASMPSRLEIPISDPPQPPTMRLQHRSPTGTVKPQKKSDPCTRMASSAIS